MKIKTINQLITVFKDAANRHYQINGFGIGDNWEVGASKANMHPVLWINPVSAIMAESENNIGYKTFEIDFEIRVFDLVNKDESNENEVLSDTIDILKDIITEFKGHPYYTNSQLNIVNDINFEPFTEEFDEEVSGWVCELSLKSPLVSSWCGLPMAEIEGFSFPGNDCEGYNAVCDVTYVTDVVGTYPIEVTTASGNTKIISIDTSSLSANTFTTGGTLIDKTIYFDRNDSLSAYTVDLSTLSVTLTDGNATTANGTSVDLGGSFTQTITTLLGSNTETFNIGANTAGGNINTTNINSTSVQINSNTTYDIDGVGTFININPGEFSATNNANPATRSQIINGSSLASLYFTSNKVFRLYLDAAGIAPGSGESFTINGVTFTEGIDFIGQGNSILDAATIAALNYSSVPSFEDVIDEGLGSIKFTFSNPAYVSETLTNGYFLILNWQSTVQSNNNGVQLEVKDTYGIPYTSFIIGDSETIFTDNSASPKGIQYGANYDATLVDDSLITKRYVDNAIAGITDNNYYTTGTTIVGNTLYFDRNDSLSAYTADLSSIVTPDTNFANTDLTLTGNRTHQLNGNSLNINNGATNVFTVNSFNDVLARGKGTTNNTIIGFNTARSLTSSDVTILGDLAGQSLTTGGNNVLLGRSAGQGLTTGLSNVMIGRDAGLSLTTISESVFIGRDAGRNITGTSNRSVVIGAQAMRDGGSTDNTAIGNKALLGGGTQFNVAVGALAGSTNVGGGTNVFIGYNAQPLSDTNFNSIVIGGNSVGLGSNTVVIGNSSITQTRLKGRVEMDTTTNGILLPRLTTAQMNAIASPATNLLVFNTDLNGLYRYNGSAWVALSTGYGIISVNDASGAPTYYATFKSAVDAIGGNGVVNLHSNISVTALGEMPTIGANDTLTINGNGYTITHTCNSGDNFHLVDCTATTAKIYLNNVKIVSNGTAGGTYVAEVFGGINNSPSLIQLSEDSIITASNNNIANFTTLRGGTILTLANVTGLAMAVENAKVTVAGGGSASYRNCYITVVSGYSLGNGNGLEIINCIITGNATTAAPISIKPGTKFWNNYLYVSTGANPAITVNSGTPNKHINIYGCYIYHLGTGVGINSVYISEIHNTHVYVEGNTAVYTQQGFPTYEYNGATIKNCTFITNSTAHSAYSSLNVNTRKLQNVTAVCRNAANTQPAFNISMNYSSAILTVTDCEAIVNNASAYNFQTTSSLSGVYIYGLKMSVLGLGLNLSTTLLNTNTTDAFGNVKMG